MRRPIYIFVLLLALQLLAPAAEVSFSAPERVTAGTPVDIVTHGSGQATLYVVGPGQASKRTVKLGELVTLSSEEVRAAGRYILILRDGDSTKERDFWAMAAEPANVSFLARPSRVPTSEPKAISGVAFVFDKYNNTVLQPSKVKFEMAMPGTATQAHVVESQLGVAWVTLDASRKEGAASFSAAVNDASVKRVVQQAAAEPCNLRMRAQPAKNGLLLETDPVRDCSGNPVPDGTIVTFTAVGPDGKTTVDARVKRGVARAELPLSERATITVASGVVVGNEITWGGGR